MRILLATAVAIAPLMAASGAMAEVVISTSRTTPITTSNATGSGPDNIRIGTGGSIALNTGTAVTLDSNNSVDVDPDTSIVMTHAADGATGILVNGGNTGAVMIGGTVIITDDLDPETDRDTDNDGDIDGPTAHGSGRYGVRVVGAAPFTGNVTVEQTGTVLVEGNNSYGISVEAPLIGNLQSLGTVVVTGDNSYGIRATGPITGDVRLAGSMNVTGQGSTGLSVEGDVSGRVTIGSSIQVTGYRYTTRPADRPEGYTENAAQNEAVIFVDELDPDDLLQGGPGVNIAASVAHGVILDSPPTYVGGIEGDGDGDGVKNGDEDDDGDGIINRNDSDRDGNGITDSVEGSGSVFSNGSAPAIQIGSASRDIVLGAVGSGDMAYGFINQGSVSGQGVYDGFNANGIVLGGNAGQTVDIVGGIRNDGTVAALARQANATALRFGEGTTAPVLLNNGTITGAAATSVASTVTSVQIDAGATVNSIVNNGTILATAGGGAANTTAIIDRSGTLTSITNTRNLQATLSPNAAGDPVTGVSTAIDVSANTTGVTILQSGVAFAASANDPDTDGDGVSDSHEPLLVGAIKLGSGADVLDIRNGQVIGDIAFGAGADRLSITGGASVTGVLSDTDGALDIDVANGVLDARQTTAVTLSSLNVGADGDLIVTVDPSAGASGGFNVTGTATLATGAGLGVRFNSLLTTPDRYTLIDAGTLNVGAIDLDSIGQNSPYLYVVEAGVDTAAGQVYADVRQRTAEEAGMIKVESEFYNSFYSALGEDGASQLRNVFLAQTDREDFFNLYEQLLPDHSGGPLLSLASGVDAVTRALTGRNATAAPGETSAWVQEINFYADKDKTESYGFRSEGFGVAGGVEKGTDLGALGVSVAFTSSDLEDPEAEAEEVLSASLLELGLYWRAQGQYWTTWARAAAGYAWFNSDRSFVGGGLNLSNESDWNGVTLTAAGGVSYERTYGRFTIRPEAYAEYFGLSEDGHVETGGGDGFDLDIDDRSGHMFSATAAINIAMSMGERSWLKPELRFGWRQNISVDPGETVARFVAGGPDFTLTADSIEGGGPLVGLRLNVGNELGMLTMSADAEMIDNYVRYMIFLRASFRF